MENLLRYTFFWSILLFSKCQNVDISKPGTATGFSSMIKLLMQADLKEILNKEGSYTIFAPTNEAFTELNPVSIRHMLLSTERLKKILLYHIVSGKILSQDITHGLKIRTLHGDNVEFSVSFTGMKVNNASIVDGNVEATNGVIHVINKVLLPVEEIKAIEKAKISTANVMEVAKKTGLTKFVQYINELGLDEFLKMQGPFTVFAPSDEAFSELSPESMALLKGEDDTFRSILLYHILPGEIPSSQLINDQQMPSVQGQSLRFNKFDKTDKLISAINGADIINRDLLATNGIMYIVDKVLIPPEGDIMNVLEKGPQFSLFVDAVKTAGMFEFLKTDSSLTLFAPTNDAFNALEPSVLKDAMSKRGILSEIILRHVILGHHHGPLFSTAICWDTITSANNVRLQTGMGAKGILKIGTPYGNASIIETDLMATNGVIHVIDGVI